MVLQSAALIARNKGVVRRLHPLLRGYKATFTTLYDSLNELLEVAARWSPNYSSISAPSPLELFFFHLKGSTQAFGLQVTRSYRKPNLFALRKRTVKKLKGPNKMSGLAALGNSIRAHTNAKLYSAIECLCTSWRFWHCKKLRELRAAREAN